MWGKATRKKVLRVRFEILNRFIPEKNVIDTFSEMEAALLAEAFGSDDDEDVLLPPAADAVGDGEAVAAGTAEGDGVEDVEEGEVEDAGAAGDGGGGGGAGDPGRTRYQEIFGDDDDGDGEAHGDDCGSPRKWLVLGTRAVRAGSGSRGPEAPASLAYTIDPLYDRECIAAAC